MKGDIGVRAMAFKLSKTKARLAKVGAICAIIGIVLGIAGTLFIQNYNPKDKTSVDNASVVFNRIIEQNELVCASTDYTFVERAASNAKLFNIIDIPFTDNAFWYRYTGTIKAAVNLSDAKYGRDGNTITITLSAPYISSNTPDMKVTGVLEERNNVLNPIHVEDVDTLQRDCIKKSEKYVSADSGFMEDAKKNAEEDIKRMFTAALGEDYTINFTWRDADAAQANE